MPENDFCFCLSYQLCGGCQALLFKGNSDLFGKRLVLMDGSIIHQTMHEILFDYSVLFICAHLHNNFLGIHLLL